MQKKLTVRDDLARKYIVTTIEAGKPKQTPFFLNQSMSDIAIKKAVQNGVPVELFEGMKGFEKDYEDLKRLQFTYDVSSKKLSETVRCELVNLDGSPAFPAEKKGLKKEK